MILLVLFKLFFLLMNRIMPTKIINLGKLCLERRNNRLIKLYPSFFSHLIFHMDCSCHCAMLMENQLNNSSPSIHTFLISWIDEINSSPEIDIMRFLPTMLDGNYSCQLASYLSPSILNYVLSLTK